ncbi:MAG TPA: NapC/NirT family cytochrome c [Bacteroidales bacterium]|nr:NapC/NirT family cytochrome c [Bacteroidales bacterium]HPS63634.1 NapC/NirT family cytochrome c [Bacteroidales bacterium]
MKLPKSISNWISITGFIFAVNSLILILVLFIQALLSAHPNPYNGIFTYIILPVILVIGLLMIPLGMLINRRKTHDPDKRWPVLDMNEPRHRQKFVVISIFTFLFLIVSAMGSYEAFNYTESVEFCGKLCHKVMEPEYVTYLHSPHARVACVECHVGEGAGWYVRSKLSGLYQVYSVIFHKYTQPIETPIQNLRPARETCERCHWPEKFYSRKLRSQKVYITDSLNTEFNYDLLMKIGPNYSAMGLVEGIHWHINKEVRIEYVAPQKDRETIPWVKFTNLRTGDVQIFQDTDNMLDQKALDTLEHRVMDCMDCHNRPSHSYKSPMVYTDYAMIAGEVPKDLPFIKKVAMNVLKGPFTNKDSSLTYIRDSITNFYRTGYPAIFAQKKALIDKAINGIQQQFVLNVFPYMRASSNKYLNHIGHLESDGCFRCHSDRHKSDKGKVIPKDCNLCHTIIAQGPTGNIRYGTVDSTMEFRHPVDIGTKWKEYFCTECHRELYP